MGAKGGSQASAIPLVTPPPPPPSKKRPTAPKKHTPRIAEAVTNTRSMERHTQKSRSLHPHPTPANPQRPPKNTPGKALDPTKNSSSNPSCQCLQYWLAKRI